MPYTRSHLNRTTYCLIECKYWCCIQATHIHVCTYICTCTCICAWMQLSANVLWKAWGGALSKTPAWQYGFTVPTCQEFKSRFTEYITILHYTHVQTDTSLLSIWVHFASLNFTITALKIECANSTSAGIYVDALYSSIPYHSKVGCMCHKQSIGKPFTTKNVFCVHTHYTLHDREWTVTRWLPCTSDHVFAKRKQRL